MNILVISNLYPPHIIGGYEVLCKEIVDYLRSRGHNVTVLTSFYGLNRKRREDHVHRVLTDRIQHGQPLRLAHIPLDAFFDRDIRIVRDYIKKTKPGLLLLFNLDRLSPYIWPEIQALPVKKIYQISDYWIFHRLKQLADEEDYWKALPSQYFKRLLKGIISWISLQRLFLDRNCLKKERFVYLSRFLADFYTNQGGFEHGKVVYHGVDTSFFCPRKTELNTGTFKFVYVGQIVEHKGVHTIIEAAKDLRLRAPDLRFTVDVIGGGVNVSYVQRITAMISTSGLKDTVILRGPIPRESLPERYQEAGACLFTSLWEEPLGLVIIEAMASGLPVLSTGVGGAGEMTRHEKNGLIFMKGNSAQLSHCMERIMVDTSLRVRLAKQAREDALNLFNSETKLCEFHDYIVTAATERNPGGGGRCVSGSI